MSMRYREHSRDEIKKLIEESGSVSEAARQIGVSQPTLSLWLAKLGLKVKYTISIEEVR